MIFFLLGHRLITGREEGEVSALFPNTTGIDGDQLAVAAYPVETSVKMTPNMGRMID